MLTYFAFLKTSILYEINSQASDVLGFFYFCIFYANPFIPLLKVFIKIACFCDFQWILLRNLTVFFRNSDFAFILNQSIVKEQ